MIKRNVEHRKGPVSVKHPTPTLELAELVRLMFEPRGGLGTKFQDGILLHYRQFLTTKKFLNLIKQCLATGEEINRKFPLSESRCRHACNIITKWMRFYFYTDFGHPEGKKFLKDMRDILEEYFTVDYRLEIERRIKEACSYTPPFKVFVRNDLSQQKRFSECRKNTQILLSINSRDIATQLIKLEAEWFCGISPVDWLYQSKPGSHLLGFADWFNHVSTWVATCIVTAESSHQILKIVEKFIKITKTCWKYKSFNTVFEMLNGLNNSATRRISSIWRPKLRQDLSQTLAILESTFSSRENYNGYREELKKCEEIVLPYIGLYLTDITIWKESNSRKSNQENLKQIQKFSLDKIIKETELVFSNIVPVQARAGLYSSVISIDLDVRKFLLETHVLSFDELWEVSEIFL